MAKKTLKGWKKSNLDRSGYLNIGDEIDEALYLDIAECVPCEYSDRNFVQSGEPTDTKTIYDMEVFYHETAFFSNDGKYYYLGNLPSFEIYKFQVK